MATFAPSGVVTWDRWVRVGAASVTSSADLIWSNWVSYTTGTTSTWYPNTAANEVWYQWNDTGTIIHTTPDTVRGYGRAELGMYQPDTPEFHGQVRRFFGDTEVRALERAREDGEVANQVAAQIDQAARDRAQAHREERSRRRLEQQQHLEQQLARREAAHARGLELLELILNETELAEFRREQKVTVRGSAGGLYEVQMGPARGVHGNIYELDEHGCKMASICVAPEMRSLDGKTLPLSDGFVGQILAIKNHETELRAIGNFGGRRQCTRPNVQRLDFAVAA